MGEGGGRGALGGADRVFFTRVAGKPFAWNTSSRWCSSSALVSGPQMLSARSFMHLNTPVMVLWGWCELNGMYLSV